MDRRFRIAAILLCSSAIAGALRAQRSRSADDWLAECRRGDWGGHSRARFCEVRQTGFKATGHVSVDPGANGGMDVSGWDRDSVAVTVRIQAQAATDDAARELARQIRIVASSGTIRADGPSTSGRESWSVSFDVSVPRRSDLTGETVNGPISVDNVTGKMDLRAVNGPVRLDAVGGDVHARTTNGPLVVSLEGGRWEGAGLDGETENGPVNLTLPAAYAAHLETGTVNGPINVDYPITLQGRISFRRITTDIGGGGPPVRVVTTNGPVSVRTR